MFSSKKLFKQTYLQKLEMMYGKRFEDTTINEQYHALGQLVREVGPENIFTFGLSSEEVLNYYQNGGYRSLDYYHHNQHIQKVVEQLVNGFFPNSGFDFEIIYDSLLVQNDEFFVLKDFSSYMKAQDRVGKDFINKDIWYEKSVINIAKSRNFSSDRTIQEYADEIWSLNKIAV